MKKFLKNLFKLSEDVKLGRSIDWEKLESERVKVDSVHRRVDR